MLMKNSNAFDFTKKQIFKTLTRDNLGGEAPLKWGGPVHLHIPKASTDNACINVFALSKLLFKKIAQSRSKIEQAFFYIV